jgi:Caspase domain
MVNWAIVIGIDNYNSKPLDFAVQDAINVATWLVEKGEVDPSNLFLVLGSKAKVELPVVLQRVELIEEATVKSISFALDDLLFKSTEKGDRFYFYYSGHGISEVDNGTLRPALAAADFSEATSSSSSLQVHSIYDYFKTLDYKEQYYIFDACRNVKWSGDYNTGKFSFKPTYSGKLPHVNAYILYATASGTRALGDESGSVLTNTLLMGLTSPQAVELDEENQKLIVRANNLFSWVARQVEEAKQIVSKEDEELAYQKVRIDGERDPHFNPTLTTFEVGTYPEITEKLQYFGVLKGLEAELEKDEASSLNGNLEALVVRQSNMFQGSGLCSGYLLKPSDDEFYLGYEWHEANHLLIDTLMEGLAYQQLKVYRPINDYSNGFTLCKIAAKIQTTRFSIFELTKAANPNVYLEIGVAIGLNRPMIRIKEAEAEISRLLEGLENYNLKSYRSLKKDLSDPNWLNLTRYQTTPETVSPNNSYVIAHGDYNLPLDFSLAVAEGLKESNLTPVIIGEDNTEIITALSEDLQISAGSFEENAPFLLDAAVKAIDSARFGIYRVEEGCALDTYLSLGIAIGLGKPFVLIAKRGATLPEALKGLSINTFSSATSSDLGAKTKLASKSYLA